MAGTSATLSLPGAEARPVRGAQLGRRTARTIVAASLAILALQLACAFAAPALTGWSAFDQDISARLLPLGTRGHALGTDQVGRDELTRILVGGRYSLAIALSAATGAAAVGVTVGLIAGFYRGWVGSLCMRLAEMQASFPFIVIAIVIVAVLGASLPHLVAVLVLWGWVGFARVLYGQTLTMRAREFVLAARALGVTDARIIVRHLLPNVRASAVVVWTFTISQMLVAESSLSFLGLGVPPPLPSWGSMLADSRNLIFSAWWIAVFPGLALVLAILAVNLAGDAWRDLWDPQLRF